MTKNIAVVGCGHWGKNLVRNFGELDALVAVCDPNIELAQKFANEFLVDNLSFEKVISDERIDGVVLAVPAPLHASMAEAAMKNGKHVFVEKPIAMNELEAKNMINTSLANNVHLMVGHLLQYHPVFNAIKTLNISGELGKLQYVYSNRLSFGKIRSEEDVIWSFAPHDISMILSIIDSRPIIVKSEANSVLQSNIADMATIHIEFESGLKAHISVSWLHPYKEQKFVVIGDLGMAIFDDTKIWSEKLALYRHRTNISGKPANISKSEVEYINVPESEPLKNECQHFIDVIAGHTPLLTDAIEGLNVLNILSAATLSANENNAVRVSKNE
jgi:UDP-2-acetamido-3-amino-2,3-dideoxy-glucuronate N-acetyltransferase